MNTEIVELLKQRVALCKYFSDEQLEQLVNASRVSTHEPQEAVIVFGEDADFLGVLLEATWQSSFQGTAPNTQLLGRMTTGDTFGELALMSGEKTMADFIAETPCKVLRIPRDVFQSAIITNPRAVQHVSRTISERFQKIMADPAKSAAAFRQSDDPTVCISKASDGRISWSSTAARPP